MQNRQICVEPCGEMHYVFSLLIHGNGCLRCSNNICWKWSVNILVKNGKFLFLLLCFVNNSKFESYVERFSECSSDVEIRQSNFTWDARVPQFAGPINDASYFIFDLRLTLVLVTLPEAWSLKTVNRIYKALVVLLISHLPSARVLQSYTRVNVQVFRSRFKRRDCSSEQLFTIFGGHQIDVQTASAAVFATWTWESIS